MHKGRSTQRLVAFIKSCRPTKRIKFVAATLAFIFITGFLFPDECIIPVAGATTKDWNHETFWYYPWGQSGTHKGIDIFAPEKTPVVASSSGVVILVADLSRGGNIVLTLGSKWRLQYYAHLESFTVKFGTFLSAGDTLGYVGTTGNAVLKPPHLHYSVVTLFPYPWRWSASPQGWKQIFYLNPHDLLMSESN